MRPLLTPPSTDSTARLGSGEPVFGAPCWVSLMARDLGAALDFYGAVFGWTFRSGGLG
ncbi:VOC family protein, partial [Streptomyces sp. NPDC048361]